MRKQTLRTSIKSAMVPISAAALLLGGMSLLCVNAVAQEPPQAPPAAASAPNPGPAPESAPPARQEQDAVAPNADPDGASAQPPERQAANRSVDGPAGPPPEDRACGSRDGEKDRGPRRGGEGMERRGPDGPPMPCDGGYERDRGPRRSGEGMDRRGPDGPPMPREDGFDKDRGPRRGGEGMDRRGPDGPPMPREGGFEKGRAPRLDDGDRGFRGPDPRMLDPIRLFKDIDANGDGVITRDEFLEFHSHLFAAEGPAQDRREGPGPRAMRRGFDVRDGTPPPPERQRGPRHGEDIRPPAGPDRDGSVDSGRDRHDSQQERPADGPR